VRRRRRQASAAAATVAVAALCLVPNGPSPSPMMMMSPLETASAFQTPLSIPAPSRTAAFTAALPSRVKSKFGVQSTAVGLARASSPPSLNATSSSEERTDAHNSRTMSQVRFFGLDDGHDGRASNANNGSSETETAHHLESNEMADDLPPLLRKMADKVGKIDESRMISAVEYRNGDMPKLYSNLRYETTTRRKKTNGHGVVGDNNDDDDETLETVTVAVEARNANSGFLSSSALLCGTALGAGLLNLPSAASTAGYVPTMVASLVAWAYMTISALLTSELLINRMGETGKARNVGLLELYGSYLGDAGGKVAGVGFLVVSYVVMGVYLGEGGDQLVRLYEMAVDHGVGTSDAMIGDGGVALSSLSSTVSDSSLSMSSLIDNHSLMARAIFATAMGTFLSAAHKFNVVQGAMTHVLVPLTLLAFLAAISVGLPTADLGSLVASQNQHPEVVLNVFSLLFMSWTYHGVVPRVVYDLEGDKDEITRAIVAGSSAALVIYLTWNAVILGNILSGGDDVAGIPAVSWLVGAIGDSSAVVLGDMVGVNADMRLVTAASAASSSIDTSQFEPVLRSSVAIVSELAVITSLIGVVLGFVNEFNDAMGTLPSNSYGPKADLDKWKVALLSLLPPAIVSVALGYCSDSLCFDINNYQIIDYTGIFGSSVLFLILPALMAWENRYGEGGVDSPPRPLTVRPMVPLGKIPLGSLYKAAGTLILEQGLEKLGVFEFVREHLLHR